MRQAKETKGYRGAMMGVFEPGGDANIIFGEKYDDSFYGTACAYLLRRFGPSHWGCDSFKDLTNYVLTTQMDGVLLTVRPGCSISTSFGYYLDTEIYNKSMKAEFDARKPKEYIAISDCAIRNPIAKVLIEAMKELKRPVNVRDWYFNIVGRVRDKDLQYNEKDENIGTVTYSDLAGYGIVPEYFDRFKDKITK